MSRYETIEDGEEVAGVVLPVAPRRSFKWGVLAALAAGAATVGYMSSTQGGGELPTTLASLSDDSGELVLSVYNEEYATPPASLGTGFYKWNYNVEPGRLNYMEVSLEDETIDDSDSTYTWHVLDSDNTTMIKKAVDGQTGKSLSFKPTLEDAGSVFGISVVRSDSAGAKVSSQNFQVACKYVRREFRELTDNDRTAYFDALSTIYHTETTEGQDKYGEKYLGADYFIKKHLGAMTLEGCTPWHDSEVFVTAHSAFNLEFEGSLRSMDETLSAHYWEYTVDSARYGEYWATESPLFSSEMFGSYDTDTTSEHAYIADGRFSDVEMQVCGDDDTCPEHSIYGYMIDANCYKDTRRIERSNSVCGLPTTSKLAGCKTAERALNAKTLKRFWDDIELRYHGAQHSLIGGVRGCKYDALEELSDFAHNETVMKYAEDIMLYMSIWARDFFSDDRSDLGTYAGTVECPHSTDECTDATDCTCTLPTVIDVIDKGELDLDYAINVLIETGLYGDIAAATGWAASFDAKDDGDDISTENWEESFKDLDTAQTEALLKYVAKQGAYHSRSIMAYSLSLGSVNDPIFWAGHNAWERMWHVKRMEAEGTEDQQWWSAWNETNLLSEQSAATCSWSSSADATLPFYNLMEDSETENKYYTNKDMLRMFHPDNGKLPHIYDSLEYTHCEDSEDDEAEADREEFRGSLVSNLRRRMANKYGAKLERGYSEYEASTLNSYYDTIFDQPTLDNHGDRPIFEGTYTEEEGTYTEEKVAALAGTSSSVSTTSLAKATSEYIDSITGTDWCIYKITATMRPGTDKLLLAFVNRYLMPNAFGMESVGCNSTHLGGDYKVNFTATGSSSNNNQLHWVSGPILHGADVAAEWVEKVLMATVGTTEVRDGSEGLVYDSDNVTSNAFMHNKVQFYVPNLSGYVKNLDKDSVAHLKRKSTVATSSTDSTPVVMAHLSIPIEAKTYEIVGPLKSLDSDTADTDYTEWSSYECPTCHHLAEDYETLERRYSDTDDTTTWYDNSGAVDGRPQPMLVSVHVAVSSEQTVDEMRKDFVHLRDYTRAKWEMTESEDETCKVASLSWDAMPGVVVKYVQNNHDDLPYKKELVEYEKVWKDQYEKTYYGDGENDLPSSANWHHFLDQHIGITATQGDDGNDCDEVFAAISQGLRDDALGFSTRDESEEIHIYVGYEATTAWEYNLATGCSTDDVSFGDICGCVEENSVNVYNRKMGEDVDECPKPCWAVDDDNDCGY